MGNATWNAIFAISLSCCGFPFQDEVRITTEKNRVMSLHNYPMGTFVMTDRRQSLIRT